MNANGGVITHGSNLGLTPTTQSLTVNGSATVTAQLFNANPLGTQITFTLTGANGPQTKTVGAASDGTASFTYTGTHVGQDTITASATVGGQTITSTLPATVTWNPVGTSMTLTSSANPSYVAQQVTYTATVTAASNAAGAPAGGVAFNDNGTAISGCGAVTLSASGATTGTATCSATYTATGSHTITAAFTPSSAAFAAPTTNPSLTQTVQQVSTSATLTSSDNPSFAGQQVTYTATVTAASTAAGPPVGTVAFTDNGTAISGCAAVTLSSASPYTATCAVTYAAPGSHPIAAAFTPSSADFAAPATNPSLTQTVQQAATSLTLTSTAAPLSRCVADLRLDCGVRPVGPTGPFKFKPNPRGKLHLPPQPPLPVPPLKLPLRPLPGFSGRTVSGEVYIPSGTDVSVPGQSVTFMATVSVTAPGAGTPTGSVTFTDTNAAGATTTLGTEPLTTTGGVTSASLTTTALPPGPQTITATYGGDTNFQGSHASLTQSVEYIFAGLLPPFGLPGNLDGRGGVDPNRTIPLSFILLDAAGHPVTTATATLEVNGKPAVPQRHANVGDAFRLHGIRYQYDLKLRDQGVTSGTATLTVLTSDGNTHTFTLTVRPAPKLHPEGLKGPH